MDNRWTGAIVAIAAGLLVGAIAGFWARRRLGRERARPVLSRMGPASGAFLFWFFFSVGVMFAIGMVSPDTLKPIPRQVLNYLPRVLAAGLVVLAGYAAAAVVGGLLGGALGRATGRPQRELELGVRYSVVTLAIILALAQLGVNLTVITVLVAAVAFTVGASIAMLIGFGGRQLAAEMAAGRYLKRHLGVGAVISAGEFRGTIVDLHPATIELRAESGEVVHAPYSKVLETGPLLAGALTTRNSPE